MDGYVVVWYVAIHVSSLEMKLRTKFNLGFKLGHFFVFVQHLCHIYILRISRNNFNIYSIQLQQFKFFYFVSRGSSSCNFQSIWFSTFHLPWQFVIFYSSHMKNQIGNFPNFQTLTSLFEMKWWQNGQIPLQKVALYGDHVDYKLYLALFTIVLITNWSLFAYLEIFYLAKCYDGHVLATQMHSSIITPNHNILYLKTIVYYFLWLC